MNEITHNKIKVYEFPDCDDEDEGKIQKQLKGRIPFAVVGSNCVVDISGERKRGRKYPWGFVDSKLFWANCRGNDNYLFCLYS